MPAETPIHHLLTRARHRRRRLLKSNVTNAVRLLDGEGDLLPGVFLDQFQDTWLVSTQDRSLPPIFHQPLPDARNLYWKQLERDAKSPPRHLWGPPAPDPFLIREHDAHFEVSMLAGYSQGIFLDQRDNRARVRARTRPGDRILNTFSYTGAFSVAAALGGAITTSLDLSNTYLEWNRRNFTANHIDPETQFFCRGDTLTWLQRFAKQRRAFHGVILDPPTFSKGPQGVFRARRDYPILAQAAAAVLESPGWLLATCNDRGLSHPRFEALVRQGAEAAGRRVLQLTHTPMPPDFTGEPYLKSLWIDVE